MRFLLLLLALLVVGCASPQVDQQIAAKKEELRNLTLTMKDIEAQIPVVTERKERIKALQAENAQLKAEIARLKKKHP